MFKVSRSAEVRHELFMLAYVFILLTFAWYLISLSSRPDCREAVGICYRIATQVGSGPALISLAGIAIRSGLMLFLVSKLGRGRHALIVYSMYSY